MGQPKELTLYEKIGGDKVAIDLTATFWDEMLENEKLSHFFKNVAMSTLKHHFVQFFRVVLGKESEMPEHGDLLDYLLQTHSRLFRELQMTMKHFDEVGECLQQTLETFKIDSGIQETIMDFWDSTRCIFEYGCDVAEKERLLTAAEVRALPPASHKTMGTKTDVRLPDYSQTEVPGWLVKALSVSHNQTDVRAWTCDLTERFGPDGDMKVAGTFMYQPFMAHHVYCVALLEMAFMPAPETNLVSAKRRLEIMEVVLYPRGRHHSPLSQKLFDHMISELCKTAESMGMPKHAIQAADSNLKTFRHAFGKKTDKSDGIHAPHVLCRCKAEVKPKKEKKVKAPKKSGSSGSLHSLNDDDDSISSNGSSLSGTSASSKGGSGGGWMNFFTGQKKVMHVVHG